MRGLDAIGQGASNNRADLEEFLKGREVARSNGPILPSDDPGANLGALASGEAVGNSAEIPEPSSGLVPSSQNSGDICGEVASSEPGEDCGLEIDLAGASVAELLVFWMWVGFGTYAGEIELDERLDYFTADQVLQGWRAEIRKQSGDEREASGRGGPRGYTSGLASAIDSVTPDNVDNWKLDTQWLMFLKVEKFFMSRCYWVASKALLLLGESDGCRFAFEDWYAEHPLAKVYQGVSPSKGKRKFGELELYPLKEAIERYNEDVKGPQRTTYGAAKMACKPWKKPGDPQPRLSVVRPDGAVWTTVADIKKWLDGDRRKKDAGSCDEAA